MAACRLGRVVHVEYPYFSLACAFIYKRTGTHADANVLKHNERCLRTQIYNITSYSLYWTSLECHTVRLHHILFSYIIM